MPRSHGTGRFRPEDLRSCGNGVVFEDGALIFHPENVSIGDDVYVGHGAILKGYYQNTMEIGAGSWIGQLAFLHSAGGLTIGRRVGIAPGVKILTSAHRLTGGADQAIMDGPLDFAPVTIEDGVDLGAGAIILPGVTIEKGAQIGAGAVVTRDVRAGAIVVGSPAREIGQRR